MPSECRHVSEPCPLAIDPFDAVEVLGCIADRGLLADEFTSMEACDQQPRVPPHAVVADVDLGVWLCFDLGRIHLPTTAARWPSRRSGTPLPAIASMLRTPLSHAVLLA